MTRFIAATLLLAGVASAQQIDLSALDFLASKAEESSIVDLGPEQLQMAASFMPQGDKGAEQTKQLVKGLRGVRVRTFEFKEPGAYTPSDLEAIRTQVRKDEKWTSIVRVQSKGESSEVYMHSGGQGGMLIISAEPKEISVVNIIGPLNLESLGSLGGQFGIPNVSGGQKKLKTRTGKE